MILPSRLFFTGVPGSRWSGIAQTLEKHPSFNITDRRSSREYSHTDYVGHTGAYFGPGMEFEATLDPAYIDAAWEQPDKCKIVKSHDWAYILPSLKAAFPDDWIMLVYRPDHNSLKWWIEAGGFGITYPKYAAYKNEYNMASEITKQNRQLLSYVKEHQLKWANFSTHWVRQTFGIDIEVEFPYNDILVTVIK